MGGEPRRSGRATKGQHTKLDHEPAPVPAPTTTKKGGKDSKKGKKGKEEEVEEDDEADEEADSIIRCVCGATEDEEGWMMICCEKCTAWQHNLCMDVTEDPDHIPDVYYCEQCKPENHKALLAAMKKGEEPWAARILKRVEAEKAKKKGKKGGRKSARQSGAAVSEAASSPRAQSHKSPTPGTQDGGTKRKYEAVVEVSNGRVGLLKATRGLLKTDLMQQKASTRTSTGATAAAADSAAEPGPQVKRSKSVSETPAKVSVSSPSPKASAIEQLPKQRLPVAKALNTDLNALINAMTKDGSYLLPRGQTTTSKSLAVALDIEHALHTLLGNNQQEMAAQFRAIKHNIKANPSLLQQVLSDSVSAEELASMSSEDMASEELQKERQRLKEEADKHATLAHEAGPRYRKTHKGDELVGGDTGTKAKDIYKPPVRRGTVDLTPSDAIVDTGSPPPGTELPEEYDQPGQNLAASQPSQTETKSRSPVLRKSSSISKSGARGINRRSNAGIEEDTVMGDAADDPDLDRILKGEDGDSKPSIQMADGSAAASWTGRVEMKPLVDFATTARWIAGADIGQKIPYHQLLRSGVEVDGRIDIKRADEYISGMRYSSSTDVCCLALMPTSDEADRHAHKRLFDYLREKNRWGVYANHKNDVIRDVYVVTVEAGGPEKLPGYITMLEQSQIDQTRQEDMLLLTLVVRKTSSIPTLQSVPSNPNTPVNQQHPSFSPVPQTAPTFPQAGVPISNLAIQILGPFVNAPVVGQILAAVTDMTEIQLQNLRDILEREPATRDNIVKLSEHLTQRQRDADTNGK